MTSTSLKSKLSCKEVKKKADNKKENASSSVQSVTSTPKANKNLQMDQEDFSPVYFPSTQEASDDIDVLWDWHSPQSSQRRRKKQKRLLPVQSPKYPIKRHSSNNQNQNFEKLKDELNALKEELALPDDESCLCVSPQQEIEYKQGSGNNLDIKKQKHHTEQFDDLFNDSVDEQLLLCSQKIENDLLEKNNTNQCQDDNENSFTNICENTEIDNLIKKYNSKNFNKLKNISDDSFDMALNTFRIEDSKTQINNKSSKIHLQRTVSENQYKENSTNVIQTISGKLEFHRTKSFELEAVNDQNILPKRTLEEIERKRLEARARLASKKKEENLHCINTTTLTPTKCSPEEIEKKRLQALAKREAKRLQDIVEKNRQEAIKRLQISRSKNANLVKSTLSKRLVN